MTKAPDEIKKGLERCIRPTSDCASCPYRKPGNGDCVDEMKRDALTLIQQLEAQVPKWISVEDDLPAAVITPCLVSFDGDIYMADWSHDKYGDDWSHDKYGDDWWFYINGEYEPLVTHWMPLPEPPKEESQC